MSDHESDSDCTIEPEEVVEEEVVEPEPPKKTKSKAKPRAKPVKKIKPSKREYEEGDDEASPEEEAPKKRRGRPALSKEEKLAKQVIKTEKVIYMIPDEKKGGYKKCKPELGVRAIKKMELQAEKEKAEVALGKALVQTKKGAIDKRSSTKRTPAQIAATAKLVEANRLRREAAGKLKEAEKKEKVVNKKIEQKEIVKAAVREVVSEPYYEPKPIAPDPYGGLQF